MIQLKLGPARHADPDDPMGRDWVGWTPDQTEQELYDRNRGVWLLGAKADRQRYAVFTSVQTGKIVAVVGVTDIETFRGGKKAIVGTVLPAGHPVRDRFYGQPALDNHRNPMTYPEHPLDHVFCGCGCGEQTTARQFFLPGHDKRAVYDRINHQWGGAREFVGWFDTTYGAPPQPATTGSPSAANDIL